MSTLFSKQVQDDIKRADLLVEATRTYEAEVASRRSEQIKPLKLKSAPSEEDLRAAFRFRGVILQVRIDRLKATTAAVADEVGDDPAAFRARDEASAVVYGALRDFREVGTSVCGADAMSALGFQGTTTRDSVALETLAAHVLGKVREAPPNAKTKGVKFDAVAALDGLEAQLATLSAANAAVLRESRELVLARAARDEALAAFEREFGAAVDAIDAELRAVGLDDVADRLLPTRSRAATTAPAPDPAPTT